MNSNPFGFLAKLEFLQTLASVLISKINPAVIHNIEKYYALKKIHYLSSIEDLKGDYLEFGVFTGSSFCHSMRCYRNVFDDFYSYKVSKKAGVYRAFNEFLKDIPFKERHVFNYGMGGAIFILSERDE